MRTFVRGVAAAGMAVALLVAQAGPASALAQEVQDRGDVNVVFDAMILRPLGLAMTAVGSALFVIPVAPMVLLTRPTEIRKPLDFLVLRPARYTFQDPIGHHD